MSDQSDGGCRPPPEHEDKIWHYVTDGNERFPKLWMLTEDGKSLNMWWPGRDPSSMAEQGFRWDDIAEKQHYGAYPEEY